MLISKEVEVKWNPSNKKWYEDKGYKFTKYKDTFRIKVKDLTIHSRTKVQVKCDYCGCIIIKQYCDYIQSHNTITTDCCSNNECRNIKLQESVMLKYGKSNISQTDYFKDIYKQQMQKTYGVDNYFSLSPFIKDNNWNYQDTNIICENCGHIIHRKTSAINRSHKHFCNNTCRIEFLKRNSTQQETDRNRKSEEYFKWRTDVLQRDNYTCQCCGNMVVKQLEVHHIINFGSNVTKRFDVCNGITLCKDCHNPKRYGSFHYIYGTINNNFQQLQEYKQRLNNHEFDTLKKMNIEYKSKKYKRCSKCGRTYLNTSDNFHRDKYTKDGLTYTCKICRKRS